MRRALQSLILWGRGWSVFLLGAPVIILLSRFSGRKRLFRWIRTWCRLVLRAVGIRVEVLGAFPPVDSGPVIIVAPHVSIFDPIVLGSIVPWPVTGVELDSHFTWPVYGAIIRQLGNIPISHESPHRSRQSLHEAAERLRMGERLVILPEGHRTRTGRRRPFGLWAFRLAARTGVPILPLAFEGAWERHHVGSWLLQPGVWRVRVLPLTYPLGVHRRAAESLKRAAEAAIDGAFEKI